MSQGANICMYTNSDVYYFLLISMWFPAIIFSMFKQCPVSHMCISKSSNGMMLRHLLLELFIALRYFDILNVGIVRHMLVSYCTVC